MKGRKPKVVKKTKSRFTQSRSPAPYSGLIVGTKKVRYTAPNALSANTFVVNDLTDFLAVGGGAATTYMKACSAVRLRKVEMWAGGVSTSGGSNFTPVTVSVSFQSNGALFGSSGQFYCDTSVSTIPAHCVANTEGSYAGQWFDVGSSNTTKVIEFNGPAGTVIDMTYDYALNSDFSPVACTNTATGSAAGNFYFSSYYGAIIPIQGNYF